MSLGVALIMAELHVIHKPERKGAERPRCIDKSKEEWTTGFWKLSHKTAESLVGGKIYIHRTKAGKSTFGGNVTGYTVVPDGVCKGKMAIQFTYDPACRDVSTGSSGWGHEKKVIR